jgi:hypothetical protein
VERTRFDPAYGGAGILIYRFFIIPLLFIGCGSVDTHLPYPLTISEEGLGAIHPDTPINQVNTLLSGFEFDKLSQVSSDRNSVILQMKRGTHPIAQIVSDESGKKIAAIYINSNLIKNKQGIGLGEPLPQNDQIRCDGPECISKNEPSVHYRIDPANRTILEITFSRL